MDNDGRKRLRETIKSIRQLLESEFNGDEAWGWGMQLALSACLDARALADDVPAALAFADLQGTRPSASAEAVCRQLLAGCRELLSAPAALGWLHQYWHDGERANIAARSQTDQYAKVAAETIVPATQIYSEDYMVDFLVENSLGAVWLTHHPDSSLIAGWRGYVRNAFRPADCTPRLAASITVCDPACGAGHFLLRAMELLYDMHREENRESDAAGVCAAILNNNLYGMDIDGRAVAVARAVLWLRARELAPGFNADLAGFYRNIVAASGSRASELGSLLSASEAKEPFARLLRRRYTVVVTNPPYLDKRDYGRSVRAFLRSRYPAGAGNLYAAFILRSLQLADVYVAMVTPQTFFFIQSYTALRQSIFSQAAVRTLAQLGLGAFREAVVDAVLFVLAKNGPAEAPGVYLKLTAATDKAAALSDAVARNNRGEGGPEIFLRSLATATALPGQPALYWLGDGLRTMLETAMPLKEMADVVLGMKTSDNKRFLRQWWEVLPADNAAAGEWAIYEKEASGYRYARAAGHYVRWTDAARSFYQNHYSAQLPNRRYWFRPGLVYGLISSKAFTAKLLPAGQMTDMAASCVFPHMADDTVFLLGLLNAKVYQWLLKSLNPTVNYQPADLQRLPVPLLPAAAKEAVGRWAMEAAAAAGELRASELTDRDYRFEPGAFLPLAERLPARTLGIWRAALRYLLAADSIDHHLEQALGLPPAEQAAVCAELGETACDLPALADYDKLPFTFSPSIELPPIKIISPTEDEAAGWREKLRRLYHAGPRRGELPEIFFNRLAAQTGLHPITVYNLIAEGTVGKGWDCPAVAKGLTEDFFSAMVLAHLGHAWPGQQPLVEGRGLVPLTDNTAASPLAEGLAGFIGRYAGPSATAAAFQAIVGLPLNEWLLREFFPRHVRQFKRRPVAWQITSRPGKGEAVFSCLVHCHQAAALPVAIADQLAPPTTENVAGEELAAFRGRLAMLLDYRPRPEYGVRINIAPLQAAGILATAVLAPEDLPRALADGSRCAQEDYIL